MIRVKTLKSGVRVIVKEMEGLLSVTMGILVGTGAAFETDREDGISHFIEHMQFKGTQTRTAVQISDEFDDIGAQVNAFTGKDMTCYYAKATSERAGEAFALLSDLFLNATFPEEEMAREKGVVLEEIHMDEDSPEDLCLDLLARAAFGSDNYGRNILGPAENVKRFTREEIAAYKRGRYCPENVVISFAGKIDINEAEALAERYFGDMPKGSFERRNKKILHRGDRLFKQKPIEQVHFAFGFPSVARASETMPAVQLMNAVLGGGLSSRLFTKVREELGLAYSVYSLTSHYEETGLLTIYAGVNPEKAEGARDAILDVIRTFKEKGITKREFLRGKEQLKSGNIFSQESTSSQMLLYGKYLLYRNEIYDFEQKMQEISNLTEDDVMRAISENLDLSRAAVASVGNLKKGIEL